MKYVNAFLIAVLVALVALIAFQPQLGCQDSSKPGTPPGQPDAGPVNKGLPTVQMKIGTGTFTLEVADTYNTRQTGLMNRDSMPADHGMIFVFDEQEELGFWMKNTRIPLDIIFLDKTGRVVSVHQMKPFDETDIPSDGPAMYSPLPSVMSILSDITGR